MSHIKTKHSCCSAILIAIICSIVSTSSLAAEALPIREQPLKTEKFESKRGEITVETYSKLDNCTRYRILTKHYKIYSELKKEEHAPEKLGKILEALWENMEAFTGVKPKQEKRWQVEIYRTRAHMKKFASGFKGQGIFMYGSQKVHLIRIPGPVWWTRTMLCHEVAHQFHFKSGVRTGEKIGHGSCSKFPFIQEGFATWFEGNRWDPKTETLTIGAPLPGRSNAGVKQVKNFPRTFDGFIMGKMPRDASFNLIMFLIHEKTPQMMRLLKDTRDPKVAWTAAFGTLELDEKWWEEYDAFVKKVCDNSLKNADPKEFKWTSWEDALKKHKRNSQKKDADVSLGVE